MPQEPERVSGEKEVLLLITGDNALPLEDIADYFYEVIPHKNMVNSGW